MSVWPSNQQRKLSCVKRAARRVKDNWPVLATIPARPSSAPARGRS